MKYTIRKYLSSTAFSTTAAIRGLSIVTSFILSCLQSWVAKNLFKHFDSDFLKKNLLDNLLNYSIYKKNNIFPFHHLELFSDVRLQSFFLKLIDTWLYNFCHKSKFFWKLFRYRQGHRSHSVSDTQYEYQTYTDFSRLNSEIIKCRFFMVKTGNIPGAYLV